MGGVTPEQEDDLEKVAGGEEYPYATYLYRCPKCGWEKRDTTYSHWHPCITCWTEMERVPGSYMKSGSEL